MLKGYETLRFVVLYHIRVFNMLAQTDTSQMSEAERREHDAARATHERAMHEAMNHLLSAAPGSDIEILFRMPYLPKTTPSSN